MTEVVIQERHIFPIVKGVAVSDALDELTSLHGIALSPIEAAAVVIHAIGEGSVITPDPQAEVSVGLVLEGIREVAEGQIPYDTGDGYVERYLGLHAVSSELGAKVAASVDK